MNKQMKILYFSPILWDDLKQRPQHLAEELAEKHTIYFIEPSISYLHSRMKHNTLYKASTQEITPNLTVTRLSGRKRLPRTMESLDILNIQARIERKKYQTMIDECDIIWLGSPIYYSIIKHKTNNKILVYDKMDDYTYLTKNIFLSRQIIRKERKLINKADIIFTTAKIFYQQLNQKRQQVYHIPNGISVEPIDNSTNKTPIQQYIEDSKREGKIIYGYIGTIDHWFDFNVITQILKYRKNNNIILIGKNKMEQYKHDRVYYFGSINNKKELLGIVRSFSYCICPFKMNEQLETINPVKIYEYLSQNKKIIAPYSLEIQAIHDKIALYKNYNQLEKILSYPNEIKTPFRDEEEIKQFIDSNSWHARGERVNNIITQRERI